MGPLLRGRDRLVDGAPASADSAAASAQNPRAIAIIPVSTTRTGTGASRAARTAAS